PRAAWRLATLGFGEIFDYMPGKADWLAFALPTEGTDATPPRAGHVARRDAPTCALTDLLGDVRADMSGARERSCIVIDRGSIVLGRVWAEALEGDPDPDSTAEDVMEAGPTSVRPDEPLEALVERMKKQDVDEMIVTTSIGELLGVLHRDEAERHLGGNAPNA